MGRRALGEEQQLVELSLGYYRGPIDRVLAVIEAAQLEGAILELDGVPSEEIYNFVEEAARDWPELHEANHRARYGDFRIGPLQVGGGPLLLPIERDNLRRLRSLAERHADAAVAFHMRVLGGDRTLVDAPDVGDNEIWISRRLPPAASDALRAALGGGLGAA